MTELSLTPPDPVDPVPVERVAGLVPLDEPTRLAAAERAGEFAAQLGALDPRSPDFTAKVDELLAVGEADMRVASAIAASLLDRSVDALAGAQGRRAGAEQRVTTSLAELRRTVTELDPGGLPTTPRKLLGLIPMGNQAKRLLDRYLAANTPVNQLVVDLRTRQDQLRRDNAAIKGERARLWDNMSRLAETAAFAEALDGAVERQAGILDYADPAAANALRADVLHPVRQRHQDVLTQLAVCAQGYLALDLVRRNNDELIRGVERACSTTVSALRVALAVSGALAGQQDVLDEVDALRSTTEGLMRSNNDLLALQTERIRQASSDPAVGLAAIRESFDQIYRAIDAVDSFRAGATESMATTVAALTGELRRAEDHLRRSRAGQLSEETK
ncbi:toxic anion resistance protein [Actinokineospora enzanensis]|uniref:toxic anion resistance protein n=1 Tax=Actinokineospora enzanensis TaxID=155975 RepID=UPI00036F9137|nr:toxic anion resistance protein [Actinokineospora enzanensis]